MRNTYTLKAGISSLFLWPAAILLLSALFLSSCSDDDEGLPPATEDITQIIENTEGLDSLFKILDFRSNGNLVFADINVELLKSNRTFFAPNNEAFARLVEAVGVNAVLELRTDILRDILNYHIVDSTQALTASQLTGELETELDDETISANGTTLNEATQPNRTPTVVVPDQPATNGIVHIVDNILLPSSITDDISPTFGTLAGYISVVGGFSQMDALLRATELRQTIANPDENYTLLAVFDGGFSNAGLDPTNISPEVANYHIIPGLPFDEQIFPTSVPTLLQGAPIYTSDLEEGVVMANFSILLLERAELPNGKIFIPAVQNSSGNTVAFSLRPPSLRSTGVGYINQFDDLTIIASAVERVPEVKSILEGDEPYTLLSPNDDAFAAAGITAEGIDTMAVATLQALLENHIIQGKLISSTELVGTTQGNLTFADGTDNHITVTDNNTETSAETVFEDILLDVGVAHDIDNVLVPE